MADTTNEHGSYDTKLSLEDLETLMTIVQEENLKIITEGSNSMIIEMLPVKGAKINFYKDTELYYKVEGGYVLYKETGFTLSDIRIVEKKHPPLFIKSVDRIDAIKEAQKGFNKEISKAAKKDGGHTRVRDLLSETVEDTFKNGNLDGDLVKGLGETIKVLSKEYADNPAVIQNLLKISSADYSTINHSISVMVLTLGYLLHYGHDLALISQVGLGALLHDVGKVKVSPVIVKAERSLHRYEFEEMKKHPIFGKEILLNHGLSKDVLDVVVGHHEKIDGSGYPNGKRDRRVSYACRLIGIVDSYEALTCDDRPYRKALEPFEALKVIKGDILNGKFDKEIFEKFVICLIY